MIYLDEDFFFFVCWESYSISLGIFLNFFSISTDVYLIGFLGMVMVMSIRLYFTWRLMLRCSRHLNGPLSGVLFLVETIP